MSEKKESLLWKTLTGNLSEDDLYQSHFNKNFWTLEQFAALVVNLSPERYLKIQESNNINYSSDNNNRISQAFAIQNKFLKDLKNKKIKDFQFIEKDIAMSPWKFIKWMASNKIPIRVKFFKSLPLYLMELLSEFQPMNIALRNKPIYSRDYHEAYYLKQAEDLIKKEGRQMTPTEIYQNPHMQNVQRHIRGLNGNYKKRTFIESWLPKLQKRKKGRPKK